MRFISLFAGVGGFDLALEKLGHKCVYANDFDKNCKLTYDKHFSNKLDCRSITSVQSSEIPDHELLCAGFPCQPFSGAGLRQGFDDTRGTLFFDVARIIKEKIPRYILLENVSGLLSHDKGRTFKTILTVLEELGYDCEWMVFDSWTFGYAPRKRVYIKGVNRQYKIHALQRNKQTISSYADLCQRLVNENHTTRNEKLGRGSARVIRTFARIPKGMDSWDSLYEEKITDRECSNTASSL